MNKYIDNTKSDYQIFQKIKRDAKKLGKITHIVVGKLGRGVNVYSYPIHKHFETLDSKERYSYLIRWFSELPTKPTKKFVFTREMLHKNNYGLFIINNRVPDFKALKRNPGYAATVSWKLGYGSSNHYFKINFLTDGWACFIADTLDGVCEYLNNNSYNEKFRLMTKEEVIYLINNRDQGFL